MSDHFGEQWFDDTVAPLQHPLTEMIQKARDSLAADKKDATPGRIVAELNFGFWVSIFGPKYDTSLWVPALRHAFPNRPKRCERKGVSGRLNAIRRLRNRVAHHEPILHRNVAQDHAQIIDALDWMCPFTAKWVAVHSRFDDVNGT